MSDVLRIQGDATPPEQRLRQEWADSLAEHLKARGLTRKQFRLMLLDRGLKVSEQAIGMWLRAETSPRPHHQAIIAAALGVPAHRLFSVTAA